MAEFANPLERWNSRFNREDYLFGEQPNAYLLEQFEKLNKGKTLCIADGEGRNSVWLASQGLEVDAFDFSPVAVEKAKKLAANRGVQANFVCSTWQSFPFQAAHFDNVVGVFFQFASPDERAQLFSKLDTCLRPGGILLIQGYGKDQLKYNTGGPGVLENLYDEALLKTAFATYTVLHSATYTAEVDEGDGHRGTSALVGFVARKPG